MPRCAQSRARIASWVFAWYVLSKLLETFDVEVLELGHVVSGHTLKHVAAAMAGVAICLMLTRRTAIDTDSRNGLRSADAMVQLSTSPSIDMRDRIP